MKFLLAGEEGTQTSVTSTYQTCMLRFYYIQVESTEQGDTYVQANTSTDDV